MEYKSMYGSILKYNDNNKLIYCEQHIHEEPLFVVYITQILGALSPNSPPN